MSQTIDRAIGLLHHFSEDTPAFGLSDLTRLSGLDKTTTFRLLGSLVKNGFLEQDQRSKSYMLGAALLHFARIREATFPLSSLVEPELQALSALTGETAHVSWLTPAGLVAIAVVQSRKANCVTFDNGVLLPFHSTASGYVVLAFSPPEARKERLKAPFIAASAHTPSSVKRVLELVGDAQTKGYAIADQTFEEEVVGIAAPIFGPAGHAEGAIAVIFPSHRATKSHTENIIRAAMASAKRLTEKRGYQVPQGLGAVGAS